MDTRWSDMRSDSNIRTGDIATHDANAKHNSCMLLAVQSALCTHVTSGANPDGRSDGSRCHTWCKCKMQFLFAFHSAKWTVHTSVLHPVQLRSSTKACVCCQLMLPNDVFLPGVVHCRSRGPCRSRVLNSSGQRVHHSSHASESLPWHRAGPFCCTRGTSSVAATCCGVQTSTTYYDVLRRTTSYWSDLG